MSHRFGETDRWLLAEGTHAELYRALGAQPSADGLGTTFGVWAPNAASVAVIGGFNGWDAGNGHMQHVGGGVWTATIAAAHPGEVYRYCITAQDGRTFEKSDPFALSAEEPPATASVIWHPGAYAWTDVEWVARRAQRQGLDQAISVYEVHLGSWRYEPDGYRGIAEQLPRYVADAGFSHVELLPIMEHPFYGSWGYQTSGYFAPTARYGSPDDLMYLIDCFHQQGVGVILDWVPSHFVGDSSFLADFDGTHLYDHADPRLGVHPDWGSLIFNYDRPEVAAFLLSSACYWLDVFHADGLRVDAVSSMLFRDYSRTDGEWIPNKYGGRENLGAIEFLRLLNEVAHERFPGTIMCAEESAAWPGVTKPVSEGGLGFDLKWDLGWMHDTLEYLAHDPIYRRYHHHDLTFRSIYAESEHFILPLSHDEVVHGKGSLLAKMPGDEWQKRANLRMLLAYQWATPGKKLLFMGGEFGAHREWDHESELDWGLLASADHSGFLSLVTDLNFWYRSEPALGADDAAGMEWIIADDSQNSAYVFVRHGGGGSPTLHVFNATPVPRYDYRFGVPLPGVWHEVLNTDAPVYGGSGVVNGLRESEPIPSHGKEHSIAVTLAPLSGAMWTLHGS